MYCIVLRQQSHVLPSILMILQNTIGCRILTTACLQHSVT